MFLADIIIMGLTDAMELAIPCLQPKVGLLVGTCIWRTRIPKTKRLTGKDSLDGNR